MESGGEWDAVGLCHSRGEGGAEGRILARDEQGRFEELGDSVWQRRGREEEEEARNDLGILGDKKNYTSFHSGKVFKHFLCARHCASWWPLKAKWGMISTIEEKAFWKEEEACWRLCLT